MLEQMFAKLLHMSFAAAWLALAVVGLRPLLKRAPRRVILLLWALVAVRLVCPVSIESRVSLVPRPETVVQSVPLPSEESSAGAVDFHPERLWLAGTGAMLLWGLWGDLRLRRRVRVSIPQGGNIRLCDEIDTPFVLGAFRPQIYLPSGLDASQAVYVLAHERAHIARHDHWWKPLGWVLLSVYWFHPLLWLAYILFCRDLELACDERVASSLDRDGLAAYSEALLSCSTRRGALASPVGFGETGVKTRVRAILRYRKPALRIVMSGLLCVIIVGALFLTDRPAAALQLTETLLPETAPNREAEWTIPLDERNEQAPDLPEVTPPPAETPAAPAQTPRPAQAPAQTSASQAQSVPTQTAEDTADSEDGSAPTSQSRTLSRAQGPIYSGDGTTSGLPQDEDPISSRSQSQSNLSQIEDVNVIKLFP